MGNPKVSYIRSHGQMADGDKIPPQLATQLISSVETADDNMARVVMLSACMSPGSAREYLRQFNYLPVPEIPCETEQEIADRKTEARVRAALKKNEETEGTPLAWGTKDTIEALLRRIDTLTWGKEG